MGGRDIIQSIKIRKIISHLFRMSYFGCKKTHLQLVALYHDLYKNINKPNVIAILEKGEFPTEQKVGKLIDDEFYLSRQFMISLLNV